MTTLAETADGDRPRRAVLAARRERLSVMHLLDRYRTRVTRPQDVLSDVLAEIDAGDPAVWIDRVDRETIMTRCKELESLKSGPEQLPLFGVPFAVKDNIDVAGRATTAACPDFARVATKTAHAVMLLERAGAILVGKTNLDQFATGLVGTRSPYGVPVNPAAPNHIPGGSSSGSAVAVAGGLVSFALGTDTAGSGRVPAAMTGTVGLKPTKGLVSTHGVLPACRSLDCVSVFANTPADAAVILDVLDDADLRDPRSRRPHERQLRPPDEVTSLRVGVPELEDLAPEVAPEVATAFATHLLRLESLGVTLVPISIEPFEGAGELLYEGPWLAERLAAVGDFVANTDHDVLEVTRRTIEGGRHWSAVDVFRGMEDLDWYRRQAEQVFADVDVIVLPSVPVLTTLEDVRAEPSATNALLGRFTNFVNLLDLAAVAVPAGDAGGVPVGFTVLGPALTDRTLLALAASYRASPAPAWPTIASPTRLAVLGAHLRGEPLHHQLVVAGARLLERTCTAPAYRLIAIHDAGPDRPALVPAADGVEIELEVYELAAAQLDLIRATTAAPLAIGPIALRDGRQVDGFVAREDAALTGPDISGHGGWRAYRRSLAIDSATSPTPTRK